MKRKCLLRNENGQVLGLPMYLIVIMIVAVAIIAAVIFMIPRGSQTMSAVVQSGSAFASTTTGVNNEAEFGVLSVNVLVTTNDERNDPIQGATVRLVGGHTVAEGTTDVDGLAEITVGVGAYLVAGINEAYMKMTVKAAGYEDFEDNTAVLLSRS